MTADSEAATHPCCRAGDGWRPIESAPDTGHERPDRLLLWNRDANCVCFGRVYRYQDGDFTAAGEGYSGEWAYTHWQPLPPPHPGNRCGPK